MTTLTFRSRPDLATTRLTGRTAISYGCASDDSRNPAKIRGGRATVSLPPGGKRVRYSDRVVTTIERGRAIPGGESHGDVLCSPVRPGVDATLHSHDGPVAGRHHRPGAARPLFH